MNLLLMDGTGNRFHVLDAFREPLPCDGDLPSFARSLCGFGSQGIRSRADGLLIVEPTEDCAGRMRVYNADGSVAEMCGNGLRCVAKLLHDRHDAGASFAIATDAGPRQVQILSASREVSEVRIGLGRPIFEPHRIPTTLHGTPPVEQPLDVDGATWLFTCVSMGNPHAVTFVNDPDDVDVHRVGPAVERHDAFPNRTNVEFAAVLSPAQIRLRVWERGVGETAACGTGAAATAVAAILTGRAERDVTISLRGGDLQISWRRDDAEVLLTGPARLLALVE
jgi:diaminopimelate epimerase